MVLVLNGFFISCFFAGSIPKSSAEIDKEAHKIVATGKSAKILVLSDLQFSNYIEMAFALSAIKRTVKLSAPDVILTTGDNFGNNAKRYHLDAFIRFMDSLEIPWGVTFGNHDYNVSFSMDEYCRTLSDSEYCIFYSERIGESHSNYSCTLSLGDNKELSLICMDTVKDGLSKEHCEWYEEKILSYAQETKSLVFFHIPPKEMLLAAENYKADPTLGTGEITDEIRTQKTDSGIFDAASRLNSTKAFFFGHDHLNNAHIDHGGIKLCYSTKTGINVYSRRESLGGVLIEFDADENITIKRILI